MSETLYLSAGDTIRLSTYLSASDIWNHPSRTLTQSIGVSGNVTLDPNTRVVLSASQPDYTPAKASDIDNSLINYDSGNGVAKEISVLSIQNNTRFVSSIPTYMLVPVNVSADVYKLTANFYDTSGTMEDPDNSDLAIYLETAGSVSKNSYLFQDYACTIALTASSNFPSSKALIKIATGRYECYFQSISGASAEQLMATFSIKENSQNLYYSRTTMLLLEEPGTSVLADNTTNKDIIAKAFKSQDITTTSATPGSIYSDWAIGIGALSSEIISTSGIATEIKEMLIDDVAIITGDTNILKNGQTTIISKEDSISASLNSLGSPMQAGTEVVLSASQPSYPVAKETSATSNKEEILTSITTISGDVNTILTSAHGSGQWDAISVIGEVVLSASQPNYPAALQDTLLSVSATQDLIKVQTDKLIYSFTSFTGDLHTLVGKTYFDCRLNGVTYLPASSRYVRCRFENASVQKTAISPVTEPQLFYDCFFGSVLSVNSENTFYFDMTNFSTNTRFEIFGGEGQINFSSMKTGRKVTIYDFKGTVTIESDCSGTFDIYSPNAVITDNSGGTTIINRYDDDTITIIKNKTNNLPSDPASNTLVATRLATSGYTAPNNTGITNIYTGILTLTADQATIISKEDSISAIQALQATEVSATANKNTTLTSITTISADVWTAPNRALTESVSVTGNVTLEPNTRVMLSAGQPDYDIPTEVNIILTSAHGSGQWDAISTTPVVLSASQPYFTPASAGDDMGIKSATLSQLIKHADTIDGKSVDYILEAAMAMVNGRFTISGDTLTLYKRDDLTPFSVITKTATSRNRTS